MARRFTSSGSPYEARYGFSRAVRQGNRIVVAGTAPIPADGQPVASGPYAQMMRCGEIALAAVESLGGAASDVVRTRMFLVDAGDADEVGRAHRALFGAAGPAATMVVAGGLLDPQWRIELEVEAIVGSDAAAE